MGSRSARDGRHLYVANRLAGSISVIDTRTSTVVHTWHVGGSPDMLQVSIDGTQLWASNRFDASVSVIDTHNGRVLHVIGWASVRTGSRSSRSRAATASGTTGCTARWRPDGPSACTGRPCGAPLVREGPSAAAPASAEEPACRAW